LGTLWGWADPLIDDSMMLRGVGQYKYPNGLIKWENMGKYGKMLIDTLKMEIGFSHV